MADLENGYLQVPLSGVGSQPAGGRRWLKVVSAIVGGPCLVLLFVMAAPGLRSVSPPDPLSLLSLFRPLAQSSLPKHGLGASGTMQSKQLFEPAPGVLGVRAPSLWNKAQPQPFVSGARPVGVQASNDYEGNKMEVPMDAFGGISPERKAATYLEKFFTFVAVKALLHQMDLVFDDEAPVSSLQTEAYTQKDGSEALKKDYKDLREFYQAVPMENANVWLEMLMTRNKMLAVRIMEVRKAYAETDFGFDMMKKIAVEDLQRGNLAVMQKWAVDAFEPNGKATPSAEYPASHPSASAEEKSADAAPTAESDQPAVTWNPHQSFHRSPYKSWPMFQDGHNR